MIALHALALAVPCAEPQAPSAPAERPPSFVVFIADDLGRGEVGCYGQKQIRTPRIDRLAAEGMRFEQFYAGAPLCAPSRCALLTGKHTGHAAIRDNLELEPEGQSPLPAGEITLAERLRERGYATAMFGKWGLGPSGSEGEPNAQGFDHSFVQLCQRRAQDHYPSYLWRDGKRVRLLDNERGDSRFDDDLFADSALAWIRQHANEPFYLQLAFTSPHVALQVPEDSLAEYAKSFAEQPYDGSRGYLPHATPRAAYAAMVTRMDRHIGRLVDLLGELGIAKDVLVLFTSDNGPAWGGVGGTDSEFFASTGGLFGSKATLYEGGVRAPLVARWPGRVPAGKTSELVCASWDLLPTLCELAGAKAPEGIDGISLVPTLLGRGEQREHQYLYWELASYSGQRAVRSGSWKLVRVELARRRAPELFDLATDPGEKRNVASEHPDVVARLEALAKSARTENPLFPLP